MEYDLNKYRHVIKPQIKSWCDDKPENPPHTMIGPLALYTSCPIVVVCYLMAELYGVTDELKKSIASLEKFYVVDSIIGKEYDV